MSDQQLNPGDVEIIVSPCMDFNTIRARIVIPKDNVNQENISRTVGMLSAAISTHAEDMAKVSKPYNERFGKGQQGGGGGGASKKPLSQEDKDALREIQDKAQELAELRDMQVPTEHKERSTFLFDHIIAEAASYTPKGSDKKNVPFNIFILLKPGKDGDLWRWNMAMDRINAAIAEATSNTLGQASSAIGDGDLPF